MSQPLLGVFLMRQWVLNVLVSFEMSQPLLMNHPPDATINLPEEAETSQKEQEHLTPIEATAKLLTFRPVISKPSELKYLLESNADPNMPIPSGKITPLRNIMSFAPTHYVFRMRDLLLEYGAKESEEEKKRWVLRQLADKAERIRMNDERDIVNERDYTP